MFSRILVAIDEPEQSQAALDLVRQLATEGVTEVRVLHLRERELSGNAWYARENPDRASFVAEAAIFELRMDGARGRRERPYRDRGPGRRGDPGRGEAFGADLIVLGRPKRGELATGLLGSVTVRVLRRSGCPVIVAPRRARQKQALTSAAAFGPALTSRPAPRPPRCARPTALRPSQPAPRPSPRPVPARAPSQPAPRPSPRPIPGCVLAPVPFTPPAS